MIHRIGRINSKSTSLYLLAFCIAIFLWTAAYPFSRACLLTQITYNEGWNVYNAQLVAEHQPLYTSVYGWTSVNYPALSFHIAAVLGRFTSDYLYTARILSLASLCLSGVLAGMIVWHTTRVKLVAWLSGLFLVAIFCANGKGYVGVDDPQILAQFFFLAGLYVYMRCNRTGWALELTALLFVVGGNIKHSLIEFPLAVLLDLLFDLTTQSLALCRCRRAAGCRISCSDQPDRRGCLCFLSSDFARLLLERRDCQGVRCASAGSAAPDSGFVDGPLLLEEPLAASVGVAARLRAGGQYIFHWWGRRYHQRNVRFYAGHRFTDRRSLGGAPRAAAGPAQRPAANRGLRRFFLLAGGPHGYLRRPLGHYCDHLPHPFGLLRQLADRSGSRTEPRRRAPFRGGGGISAAAARPGAV